MRSDELYDLFRADVVDDVSPYLWSDTEVYRYMNDAYFMFVRLTGGIPDVESRATSIPIVAGERDAELDASVLRIREAYLESNDHELRIINAQDLEELTREDYGIIRNMNNFTDPGEVRYMVIGMQDQLVRWVQVPAEDDTARLIIERLPFDQITCGGQSFDGVREEHHYHLLKWMRHLAYRKQDADSFNLVKSDQEEAAFYAYCRMAKNEKDRRRHKVRVVSYGGL
jgi:hypothetical protein